MLRCALLGVKMGSFRKPGGPELRSIRLSSTASVCKNVGSRIFFLIQKETLLVITMAHWGKISFLSSN